MGTTRRGTGPLPSLLDLEDTGMVAGTSRWTTVTIAIGAVSGILVALFLPGRPIPLLAVVLLGTGILAILSRPRFRQLWDASAAPVTVAAITAAAWFSGGSSSPLRHLLIIPIVYVAGVHGWPHIAGLTLVVLGARLVLLAGEPITAGEVAGIVMQLVVALVIATAAYALRASLGRASRELARTDEMHKVLVQSHANAVYIIGTDGHLLEVNEAAEELTGYPAEELIDRPSLRFVPPELHDEARRYFELAAGGAPQTFEAAILRADGTRVPVLATNVRITLADGRTAIHGIASDLTPALRERRAREASERRFERLAETTQDGLYVVRTDGDAREFLYVNPAMTDLTGVSAEEFYRDPQVGHRYVSADQAARVLRDNPRGEPYAEPVLLRWSHPDGDRWLEFREVPYENDTGEVVGVQGIVHDVTHLVRQQEASEAALAREQAAVEHLRRVDEMKNAFLQSVSHELRTPLTSVVGLADTVVTHFDSLPDEQVRLLLSRTVANARKLERLLSDLLDVDRMARGVLVPSLAEVDLAEVAARVLDESEELGAEVVVDLQPTRVVADAPKVERILENLLHNAVRHTPEGTTVWLRVAPEGGGAEIVVEDDGAGIEPGVAEMLFEPFTQGQDSARAPNPGTGIGLTLVARFTELHGGTVTAEDRPEGGARFRVWLPGAGRA
ncbi:MAG: PAS domain S-box protein [Actinobacteria bacterium]|nr:PAS domain S-box protein [Actinomycetota bacterium]